MNKSPPSLQSAGRKLFREESLDALQPRLHGEVILTPRMGFWWWCLLGLLILAALAWFVTQGNYTRRSTVAGHLLPAAGMIRVQSPQTGVIMERRVSEGQLVRKGDVLYVLNSDRMGSGAGAVREIQQDISREIEERLDEIIELHNKNGAPIFNPHRYTLEEGGMKQTDEIQLAFKKEADPKGLLNPGKMIAWDDPSYDYSGGVWLFKGLQKAS